MAGDAATESSEYQAMKREWTLISDIMAGCEAIRKKGIRYLPQYEEESSESYGRRLAMAPWRPEFTDIIRSVASKPFGKEVMLKGEAHKEIVGTLDAQTKARSGGVVSDIDGRGNGLTVFAQEWFRSAIGKGFHAVLVDYPTMQPGASLADERAAGARPYWVHVPADNIIALYTEMVGGKEVISHIRIREKIIRRDGFDEEAVEQIRVMEPGHWELWERDAKDQQLKLVDQGDLKRGNHTSVPIVLFFTGDRLGDMAVRPPLADLAHMQIELYQALSRQEEILTFAGSPMLAANGMDPPSAGEKIEVGPKTVLFGKPGLAPNSKPYWDFVQPAAANIKEIREHIGSLVGDMRRIGFSPLTDNSGNPTATGQAIDAAKAHSAVKAWALMLNDAIEQAFVFTAEWMGISDTVQTEVSTDFSVQPYAAEPLRALLVARAAGDLSRKTTLDTLKRFDVLSPDFDFEIEQTLIAAEPPKPAQETVQIRT